MGQYYLTVNCDKEQYLNAHRFGQGLKLLEFGCDSDGVMTGLAILLSNGNGRGGGDLNSQNPLVGSWAGARIAVAGDYGDGGKFLSEAHVERFIQDPQNVKQVKAWKKEGYPDLEAEEAFSKDICLYAYAEMYFQDISAEVLEAMKDDQLIRQVIEDREGRGQMI